MTLPSHRRRFAPKTVLAAAALTALVVAPTRARADDASDVATARALGVEGVTLAEAGRCKEAVEKLSRAEKLHHAPTTATPLGECEIALGRLVAGTEHLQRVVREPLGANAHPAFVAAVARAKKALDKALPRLASLRVGVEAPAGVALSVTIDGEAVSDAVVGVDRRVDPGGHTVVVRAEGFHPASATTTLAEGENKAVALVLRPDPAARAARTRAADGANGGARAERSGSKVPALVAFGVGAVGLGVGIYGAVAVDQRASTLDGACSADKVCPASAERDLTAARTWATVSTVGFVTAGVGAAAGVALLLTAGGGASDVAPKATAAGVSVQPTVGLGNVGLRGSF